MFTCKRKHARAPEWASDVAPQFDMKTEKGACASFLLRILRYITAILYVRMFVNQNPKAVFLSAGTGCSVSISMCHANWILEWLTTKQNKIRSSSPPPPLSSSLEILRIVYITGLCQIRNLMSRHSNLDVVHNIHLFIWGGYVSFEIGISHRLQLSVDIISRQWSTNHWLWPVNLVCCVCQ